MTNYRLPTMTPPIQPAAGFAIDLQIPAGATHAYFYSARQVNLTGQQLQRNVASGSNLPYTQDITLGDPGAQQQINDYRKEYPDAELVGFGSDSARMSPAQSIDRKLSLAQP